MRVLVGVVRVLLLLSFIIIPLMCSEHKKEVNSLEERTSTYENLLEECFPSHYKHDYQWYVDEWNKSVARGEYLQRINDELLVYNVEPVKMINDLNKINSIDKNEIYQKRINSYNDIFQEINNDYCIATIINTNIRRIYRIIIRRSLIKTVKSNWGLTQDIEQINNKLNKNRPNKKE